MPTTIYNNAGSSIDHIVVNQVSEVKTSRTVIHDIPASDKDLIQLLGTKNKRYSLKGFAINTGSVDLSTVRTNLHQLVGTTGSIESDIITQTHVFYSSLEINDKGSRPMEFGFSMDVVEVI